MNPDRTNERERAERDVVTRRVQAALPHGTLSVGEGCTVVRVAEDESRTPASLQRDDRGAVCEPMC